MDILDDITDLFDDAIKGVTKPLDEIIKGFNIIGEFFVEIAKGTGEIGEGLGQEIVEAPMGIGILGADFIRTITFGIAFIITNVLCAVKSIQNFYTCFLFYILDFLGQLAYLPIRLFLFCASYFMVGIYSYESKFWNKIEELDRMIFASIKFHIAHYPKQIRDKCYNCKRIKITSMGNILLGNIKDISGPIPNNLFGGITKMASGFQKALDAFKMFS